MYETSSEEQSLPSGLLELKAGLSKLLAVPFPQSYEERLSLLENHLLEVIKVLEKLPPNTFAGTPEHVAQSILLARQISADVRDQANQTSTLFELSDCDSAAVTGVALITLGAIGGGAVGAIAGFGYGVALLVASC
jgi:hypothetical protein